MRPATESELAEAIREARGRLTIRGGGTRAILPEAGTMLETTGLTGVELYEPGALTLVARAGTPLAQVEATLAAEGQRLPFEVPDFRALLGRAGDSTLGGVVAANASGPRRVQAGACRDSLIGVRFVTGEGTVVKNGGRVMKNVTGYDLVKLMAGSWGQLGVLSEVSFKLLPIPETGATLVLRGLTDAQAVAALSAALGSPYEVSGAAHLPGEGTFLRIEGFANSVAYRAERLRRHLAPHGTVEVEEGTARWSAIRDAAPLAGQAGDVWRVSVKPSDAPALLARIGAEAHFLDWGGGLVWALMAPGVDLRARMGGIAGHATRIRGDGPVPALPPQTGALAELEAGLRRRFDPRGLFSDTAVAAWA